MIYEDVEPKTEEEEEETKTEEESLE